MKPHSRFTHGSFFLYVARFVVCLYDYYYYYFFLSVFFFFRRFFFCSVLCLLCVCVCVRSVCKVKVLWTTNSNALKSCRQTLYNVKRHQFTLVATPHTSKWEWDRIEKKKRANKNMVRLYQFLVVLSTSFRRQWASYSRSIAMNIRDNKRIRNFHIPPRQNERKNVVVVAVVVVVRTNE